MHHVVKIILKNFKRFLISVVSFCQVGPKTAPILFLQMSSVVLLGVAPDPPFLKEKKISLYPAAVAKSLFTLAPKRAYIYILLKRGRYPTRAKIHDIGFEMSFIGSTHGIQGW